MSERTAVLVAVMLSAGCGPAPGSDAGSLDAGPLDAPAATDSGDAPGAVDTRAGDTGGTLRWNVTDVLDQYCTPLVEARCAAVAACAGQCAVAPCDRAFDLMRCIDSFNMRKGARTFFDGARLLAFRRAREAYLASCTRRPDALAQADVFASIIDGTSPGEGFGCSSPSFGVGVGGPGGACMPLPEVGAACSSVCVLPARCDMGTCVVPGDEGGACGTDVGCAAPLRCIEGICAALEDPGSSCASDLACAPGAACFAGTCTVGACGPGGTCGFGGACGMTGTCGALLTLGERCFFSADCADGLSCRVSDQTCQTAPALGERCDTFLPSGVRFRDMCAAGTYCDFATSMCVSQLPVGAPCVPDSFSYSCASGRCTGTCEARLADGQPCGDPNACLDASFCNFTTGCAPLPGLGETCGDDGVGGAYCAAGLACSGPRSGTCVPRSGAACGVGPGMECGPGLACHAGLACSCAL